MYVRRKKRKISCQDFLLFLSGEKERERERKREKAERGKRERKREKAERGKKEKERERERTERGETGKERKKKDSFSFDLRTFLTSLSFFFLSFHFLK